MIKRVKYKKFRGFNEIELSDFKPITLISGKNNAGKSSVLEGLFLAFDHLAPDSFVKINQFRGMPISSEPISLWEPMFYNLNTAEPLCIEMDLDNSKIELEYVRDDSYVPSPSTSLGIEPDALNQFITSAKSTYTMKFLFKKDEYIEEGHFITSPSGLMRNLSTNEENKQIKPMPRVQFINSSITGNANIIIEWFGKLELEGKKQQVIDILKIVDASISDVTTIAMNNQIQLYARINEKLLPLKVAGDGLNKLLFIILAILENPKSVILVDEIETGFHYSTYSKLWETIAKAAKESECQVIASTHSYECIVGAIEGMEKAGTEEDFCYFRINKNDSKSFAYRYSDELLRTAIMTEMEVR